MKAVILCGGKGTRLRELTDDIPKPLAPVENKPILWHIMKLYSHYGINDFILLLGYKGDKIKEYFMNYRWKNNHFKLNTNNGEVVYFSSPEKWTITFLDTGSETMTGGRLLRAKNFINEETFMLTYGDGLSNVNLIELLEYHHKMGRTATLTGITKKSQYGIITVKDGVAKSFKEKSEVEGIINGGFFILNKEIFNYLDNDETILEQEPLNRLVKENQLVVYQHDGFWHAVDTYKDLLIVNELWKSNKPWKIN